MSRKGIRSEYLIQSDLLLGRSKAASRSPTAISSRAIRLGYLVELVLSFAVGFGLARYEWKSAGVSPGVLPVYLLPGFLMGSFLLGFAFVQGLGLLGEEFGKHRARRWGLGRWTWASVNLLPLVAFLCVLVTSVVYRVQALASPDSASFNRAYFRADDFFFSACNVMVAIFIGLAPISLAVLWLRTLFIRPSRDSERDAREWAGLTFGAALFVSTGLLVLGVVLAAM